MAEATEKIKANKKKTEYSDKISNEINSKVAKIVCEGTEILNQLQELKTISLSPVLDEKLGGGLKEGTITVIGGPPKCGKSVTALSFCAEAQQKHGKNIYYFDVETRLTEKHLKDIKGLDIDNNFKVIGPTEEQQEVTAEMYLRTLERLIRTVPNLVAVVDSTSNMLPEEEMAGEIRSGIRAGLPKLLTQFLKRTSGDIPRTGAIIIFITHKIANTGARGPMAPKTMMDGGNQLQYQASTIIEIAGKSYWTQKGADTEEIGLQVYWNVKTSAADGKPGTKCESWLRWGVGIDRAKEILGMASELGIVKAAGSWYTITHAINKQDDERVQAMIKRAGIDPEDDKAVASLFKFQGAIKVLHWMDENPEMLEILTEEVEAIPL